MLQKNVDMVIISNFDGHTIEAAPYRIASEVRSAGYTCQIIETSAKQGKLFTDEEFFAIMTHVIGPNTKVLGVASTFFSGKHYWGDTSSQWFTEYFGFSLVLFHTLFEMVKKINPDIKIMLGGAYAHDMSCPYIDVFMLGMADKAIIEYLRYVEGKNPTFQHSINENNKMVINGNQFPFDFSTSYTRYHKADNLRYGISATIEIARGCVFDCSFCSYPDRAKNKNDHIKLGYVLKEELLRNYNEHGITRYMVTDSTFNDNTKKLEMVADIAQSLPFKLEYACYLRLDLLRAKPEQYQLLKDSGLAGCMFGIESLNHASLKCIGKGLHPDKVIEELYVVRDKLPTVGVTGGFICGLPFETKESIEKWTTTISDPDFPIDFLIMLVFFLNTNVVNTQSVYKSTFEKDAHKYYTWTSPVDWHNGNFDRLWASQFTKKFTDSIYYKQKIGGFESILRFKPWTTSVVKRLFPPMVPWLIKTEIANVKEYKDKILSSINMNL